ncbi:MAG: hypothetical protein CMH54_06580, partial [Myxococcales bacterium]|nr:hypothetical protein [Myxococcales bacterium]
TTDEGTTDEGTTDEGTTDEGTTDEGTTDDIVTDPCENVACAAPPEHGTVACVEGACVLSCDDHYALEGDLCVDIDECTTANGECGDPLLFLCTNNDGAPPTCTAKDVCGDGVVGESEGCDDGNTSSNDACTEYCTLNVCGDGHLFEGVEECDDGNTISGDGCEADCTLVVTESIELNGYTWYLANKGQNCASACGDLGMTCIDLVMVNYIEDSCSPEHAVCPNFFGGLPCVTDGDGPRIDYDGDTPIRCRYRDHNYEGMTCTYSAGSSTAHFCACDGPGEIDIDGDGYSPSDGDCCETVADCVNPAQVNPGAYEFVGNGLDDDCDPTTSDTTPPSDCSTTTAFNNVTGLQLAQAMGLCDFTTEDSGRWGVISAELTNANGTTPSATVLNHMQNQQTAVLENYSINVVPQDGVTMVGLSNGKMRDATDPGFVPPGPGTSFGNYSQPPSHYLAAHGGELPFSSTCSGICPAGDGANDGVNLRLTIRVPTNAVSFQYHHRFFSAEYWNYSCNPSNDFHLALLQSAGPGIPSDTNIAFDSSNNPMSVNNGFFEVCVPKGCYMCTSGTADLEGTGMDLNFFGGGTPWLVTTAPVVPGEIITLDLMIFDVADDAWDSLVLFDAWQWSVIDSGVGTQVSP